MINSQKNIMKKYFTSCILLFLLAGASMCKKDKTPEQEPEKEKKAVVTTITGTGGSGFLDGPALSAKFQYPQDIAIYNGAMYVTDRYNYRIRKISTSGQVSTFAGNGNFGVENGNGTNAEFKYPGMITVDANGNLYVLDESNPQVRKITPAADVSVYAGTGDYGFKDTTVVAARFKICQGIAADAQGNIYVADTDNYRIRKISTAGQVTTIAGSGIPGHKDGFAAAARFNQPYGIALDAQGNIYVCDNGNYCIRKITPAGVVSTFAGSGFDGFADGDGAVAQFSFLPDIAIDSKGNIYVIDRHRIRKITSAGVVSTLAGSTGGFADGAGAEAKFYFPKGLAIDGADNIYVAEDGNHRIRKISFE
jgi:sugar lactone lactonase YvrE